MSTNARFKEDQIILLELLPEFALIEMFKVGMPAQDEITRALVKFTRDKEVPVSLCFASQILLDVHHGLRYSTDRAFNDLRLSDMRISKTIDEYGAFSRTFKGKPRFWPKEGDEYILDLQKCIEAWIENDVFMKGKKQVLPNIMQGGMEKHFLLRSHGILCGLTMFHFTLRMQHSSLLLVNQWYDIPQMAYLYNICQQIGLKGLRSGPDMDAFIAMHGEEHIFIGGRPETAEDAIKKLSLATGIRNPSDYARDSRNKSGAPASNAKSRLMAPSAAVVNLFNDRYLTDGAGKMSVENVDKLITEITNGTGASQEEQDVNVGTDLVHQHWNNSHRLGALQLLAAIKQGMYHEEPQLQFNYFGLHKRCIELFRLIQTKEDHALKTYFTADYMANDTMIGNLTMLILTVAERFNQLIRQCGVSLPGLPELGGRIIDSCEEVMAEFLRTEGDRACMELMAFCRNKSLSSLKGSQLQDQENAHLANIGDDSGWMYTTKQIHPGDRHFVEFSILGVS